MTRTNVTLFTIVVSLEYWYHIIEAKQKDALDLGEIGGQGDVILIYKPN